MTYIATSYTDAAHKTRVIVDSSESMSEGTMFDMTNNGFTCRRFRTTEQAYIDYSNGAELDVAIVPGDNGRNFKRIVVAA